MQHAKPEDVGLDSSSLEQIKPRMSDYTDSRRIAGIGTLVARHGRIVHLESFGSADLERNVPIQPDTIYRIYSMSKPITIVAALMLYEQGLFGLNDPIADYIPAFRDVTVADGDRVVPAVRPVTIRQLMNHTAGLSYDGGDTSTRDAYARLERLEEAEGVSTTAFIDTLAAIPLLFQPGDRWHYGYSIDVIGRLIEVVSGMTLGAFLERNIFAPLGMVDTGFSVPAGAAHRLSGLYEPEDDARKDLEGNLRLQDDPQTSRYLKAIGVESGGGGLVSTITDYARFAQMLVNGGELDGHRILGPKTIALMTGDHLNARHKADYDWADHRGYTMGLGVRVMENLPESGINGSIGEYGWAGMAGSWVWIDPAEDLVAVFMPQLVPDGYYPAFRQFITAVYASVR